MGVGTTGTVPAALRGNLTPEAPQAPDTPQTPESTQGWRARFVGRLAAALRMVWPALALCLLSRAVTLVVVDWVARARGEDPWGYLIKGDGSWYLQIAERGYDTSVGFYPSGRMHYTDLAFFPGYPGLIRPVAALLGGNYPAAGVVVSTLSALAAACALLLIGREVYGYRAGVVLAGLWVASPLAITLSLVYSEALFTALAAWSLYALLRRRWLTAGLLCALAGLVRPTGIAVAAAVGAAALVAAVHRRDGWRPYAAAALAPLGLLAFWGYVGHAVGRPDGWFWIQRSAWRMHPEFGTFALHWIRLSLTADVTFAVLATTVVLVVSFVLMLHMAACRVPLPLTVFVAVLFVLALNASNFYQAEPRFLFPAFPLLMAPAAALARAHPRTLALLLGFAFLVAGWFGAYLLVLWPGPF